MMKLGVFTVSLPDWTPVETLEKLAGMGYDGVSWRTIKDPGGDTKTFWRNNLCTMSAEQLIERAGELKAAAAKFKMQMPSLSAYISADDPAAVELHFKAANAVGAKTIRVGVGGYDPAVGGFWASFKKMREAYKKVEGLAAKYGVRAGMETHPGCLNPSVATSRMLLEGLDPKHVGVIWDPCNTQVEGYEPPHMALELAGPYLLEVHVKGHRWANAADAAGKPLYAFNPAPISQSCVDWPEIIKLLKQAKYDGWLFFEDFCTEQPMAERTKANHDYLRGLIGK
jgi:sugar phosphate isomerase/epimerase